MFMAAHQKVAQANLLVDLLSQDNRAVSGAVFLCLPKRLVSQGRGISRIVPLQELPPQWH